MVINIHKDNRGQLSPVDFEMNFRRKSFESEWFHTLVYWKVQLNFLLGIYASQKIDIRRRGLGSSTSCRCLISFLLNSIFISQFMGINIKEILWISEKSYQERVATNVAPSRSISLLLLISFMALWRENDSERNISHLIKIFSPAKPAIKKMGKGKCFFYEMQEF